MRLKLKSGTGIFSRIGSSSSESRYHGDSCNLTVTGNLNFRVNGVDFELYSGSGELWLHVAGGVGDLLHYDTRLGLSPSPLLQNISFNQGVYTLIYKVTYLESEYSIHVRLEEDGDIFNPVLETILISVREIEEEEE